VDARLDKPIKSTVTHKSDFLQEIGSLNLDFAIIIDLMKGTIHIVGFTTKISTLKTKPNFS
jgi:hypothetical protein